MPYIKLEERTKFKDAVDAIIPIIVEGNETPYIKGEYFGFFVNRVTKRFMGSDYAANSFNSAFFNESKKKTLASYADKISAMLNRSDPLGSAGDFNYSITSVYWGILGGHETAESARYGMRAYLTGIIEKIYSNIESVNNGSQSDATMAFRRHLVIRGVLHDVLSETYRRQTAYYEDEKRYESKDIWELGKLALPVQEAE